MDNPNWVQAFECAGQKAAGIQVEIASLKEKRGNNAVTLPQLLKGDAKADVAEPEAGRPDQTDGALHVNVSTPSGERQAPPKTEDGTDIEDSEQDHATAMYHLRQLAGGSHSAMARPPAAAGGAGAVHALSDSAEDASLQPVVPNAPISWQGLYEDVRYKLYQSQFLREQCSDDGIAALFQKAGAVDSTDGGFHQMATPFATHHCQADAVAAGAVDLQENVTIGEQWVGLQPSPVCAIDGSSVANTEANAEMAGVQQPDGSGQSSVGSSKALMMPASAADLQVQAVLDELDELLSGKLYKQSTGKQQQQQQLSCPDEHAAVLGIVCQPEQHAELLAGSLSRSSSSSCIEAESRARGRNNACRSRSTAWHSSPRRRRSSSMPPPANPAPLTDTDTRRRSAADDSVGTGHGQDKCLKIQQNRQSISELQDILAHLHLAAAFCPFGLADGSRSSTGADSAAQPEAATAVAAAAAVSNSPATALGTPHASSPRAVLPVQERAQATSLFDWGQAGQRPSNSSDDSSMNLNISALSSLSGSARAPTAGASHFSITSAAKEATDSPDSTADSHQAAVTAAAGSPAFNSPMRRPGDLYQQLLRRSKSNTRSPSPRRSSNARQYSDARPLIDASEQLGASAAGRLTVPAPSAVASSSASHAQATGLNGSSSHSASPVKQCSALHVPGRDNKSRATCGTCGSPVMAVRPAASPHRQQQQDSLPNPAADVAGSTATAAAAAAAAAGHTERQTSWMRQKQADSPVKARTAVPLASSLDLNDLFAASGPQVKHSGSTLVKGQGSGITNKRSTPPALPSKQSANQKGSCNLTNFVKRGSYSSKPVSKSSTTSQQQAIVDKAQNKAAPCGSSTTKPLARLASTAGKATIKTGQLVPVAAGPPVAASAISFGQLLQAAVLEQAMRRVSATAEEAVLVDQSLRSTASDASTAGTQAVHAHFGPKPAPDVAAGSAVQQPSTVRPSTAQGWPQTAEPAASCRRDNSSNASKAKDLFVYRLQPTNDAAAEDNSTSCPSLTAAAATAAALQTLTDCAVREAAASGAASSTGSSEPGSMRALFNRSSCSSNSSIDPAAVKGSIPRAVRHSMSAKSAASSASVSSSGSKVWRPGGQRTSLKDDCRKLQAYESARRAFQCAAAPEAEEPAAVRVSQDSQDSSIAGSAAVSTDAKQPKTSGTRTLPCKPMCAASFSKSAAAGPQNSATVQEQGVQAGLQTEQLTKPVMRLTTPGRLEASAGSAGMASTTAQVVEAVKAAQLALLQKHRQLTQMKQAMVEGRYGVAATPTSSPVPPGSGKRSPIRLAGHDSKLASSKSPSPLKGVRAATLASRSVPQSLAAHAGSGKFRCSEGTDAAQTTAAAMAAPLRRQSSNTTLLGLSSSPITTIRVAKSPASTMAQACYRQHKSDRSEFAGELADVLKLLPEEMQALATGRPSSPGAAVDSPAPQQRHAGYFASPAAGSIAEDASLFSSSDIVNHLAVAAAVAPRLSKSVAGPVLGLARASSGGSPQLGLAHANNSGSPFALDAATAAPLHRVNSSQPPWSSGPRRLSSSGLTGEQLLVNYRRNSAAEAAEVVAAMEGVNTSGSSSGTLQLDALVRAYNALSKYRSSPEKAAALASLMANISGVRGQQLQGLAALQQAATADGMVVDRPAEGTSSAQEMGLAAAHASNVGDAAAAHKDSTSALHRTTSAEGGSKLDVLGRGLVGVSYSRAGSLQQREGAGSPLATTGSAAPTSSILHTLKQDALLSWQRASPERQAAHASLLSTPVHRRPGSYAAGLAALAGPSKGQLAGSAGSSDITVRPSTAEQGARDRDSRGVDMPSSVMSPTASAAGAAGVGLWHQGQQGVAEGEVEGGSSSTGIVFMHASNTGAVSITGAKGTRAAGTLLRDTATGRAVLRGIGDSSSSLTAQQAVQWVQVALTNLPSQAWESSIRQQQQGQGGSARNSPTPSRPKSRSHSRPCSPFSCFGPADSMGSDEELPAPLQQQQQQHKSVRYEVDNTRQQMLLVVSAGVAADGSSPAVVTKYVVTGVTLPDQGINTSSTLGLLTSGGCHLVQLASEREWALMLAGLNSMLLLQEQAGEQAAKRATCAICDTVWSTAVEGVQDPGVWIVH